MHQHHSVVPTLQPQSDVILREKSEDRAQVFISSTPATPERSGEYIIDIPGATHGTVHHTPAGKFLTVRPKSLSVAGQLPSTYMDKEGSMFAQIP